MAETLGMLCDKLTIVKLKQYHTDDDQKTESLNKQALQLQEEIDEYVGNAVSGNIPLEKLTFASNKVFKKEGNEVAEVAGGIGAVLVMCCIAVLMLFVFPSRSVTGTVSGVSWQTSVPVQEVQPVNYSNERGNPPSDAYNVSCRTDSQEVCEDKTIDKGNGYAEVVTECHTVKDQYCSYTVDEWTTIQTYDLNGTDLNPEYSSPNISSDQRLGNSSTQLQVYFSTSDGELTYSPNSVTEFQQYQPGSQWTLKLNAVGSVLSVER